MSAPTARWPITTDRSGPWRPVRKPNLSQIFANLNVMQGVQASQPGFRQSDTGERYATRYEKYLHALPIGFYGR